VQRLVSDERLSRRLATGEAAAFDEIYRRYAHRLSAYASSLLGDRHAGEDVAQVALLNAYQSLRAGKEPDRVRPWLFRIAHNEAVDMLARRRELLNGIDLDERPAPEDGGAVRGALLDALAKLPDRQRRAYLLREVHGLRIAEIAAELSLAAPQVEQALFAARNRLAEALVFGESLTCDAARRLLEGPLAAVERKALRHHFRTCDACRATGVRVAPGLVSLEWLRGRIVDLLVGGAAPAAAKVGAVVAASVATGVAVGPPSLTNEPHRTAPMLLAAVPGPHRRPAAEPQRLPAAQPVALVRAATRLPAAVPVARRDRHEGESRHRAGPHETERRGRDGGGGDRGSVSVYTTAATTVADGERRGSDDVQTIATPPATIIPTTTTSADDHEGHGSDDSALLTTTTEDGGGDSGHGGHPGRGY
jgi:RNA polymerase sigma factor (sigma-70 family)